MPQSESKSILQSLIKRNLKFHFIYTNASPFNRHSKLWKMFPELKHYLGVALDYLPSIWHLQMLEEERLLLIKVIEKRLTQFFK
jgi:hypothetical protein